MFEDSAAGFPLSSSPPSVSLTHSLSFSFERGGAASSAELTNTQKAGSRRSGLYGALAEDLRLKLAWLLLH